MSSSKNINKPYWNDHDDGSMPLTGEWITIIYVLKRWKLLIFYRFWLLKIEPKNVLSINIGIGHGFDF